MSHAGLAHRRPQSLALRWWLALMVAAVFSGAAQAQAQACTRLIATGNPEYPPFLWREGADSARLIGANADLMQMLAKEIGLPIEVRYVGTWARVQEEARQGRVDLIAGAFFTLPRLEYMDYVYPAFQVTRSLVWSRTSTEMNHQRWSDLQGKSGLTVINNSFGEAFDRYAKASLKISTVPSLEQALRMLERGRADYLVYEEAPAQAYIARLGIQGVTPAEAAISNEGLYLTLSHQSPCNTAAVRARLAKAMYQFERQNVMKKLLETNVQVWRAMK